MVFSTISAYLDPANWQQQPNYGTGSTGPIPPPPPPPPQPHGAAGAGSMADRARMANISVPETALKCPRCESTNTKFCYFNNYSSSQPRHFCKTCRRYWTRGGGLRSVPVGGGCRRNKRSSKATSSNTSKSPANSETAANSGSTTSSTLPSNKNNNNILGGLTSEISQLRFMSPLSHYGPGEIGMSYGGISASDGATGEMNFQIGSNLFGGGGGVGSVLSSGEGEEAWRLKQGQHFIPNFLGGFDATTQGGILYPNYYQESGGYVGANLSNPSMLSQSVVKMEAGNNNNSNNQDCHESNSGRAQFLGSVEGGSDDHQWNSSGTAAWKDLSGFNSSSTSNY